MTTFVQPYFWASNWSRASAPHAVSVLVTAPTFEPISLAEAKGYARIKITDEDGLIAGYIRAARAQVEQDTGLALPTQTRDVAFDVVRGSLIQLPEQSLPLQSVTSIKTTDTSGTVNTLATTQYVVDLSSGRISLSESGAWPSDLRAFQPWVIRIVAGWTTAALMPPLLVHAVGLLTAHYATLGRDLASVEPAEAIPMGYQAAISGYVRIAVA